MEQNDLILRRLAAHHLLQPADTQTVVKDLCGVQAQFLSHARYSLSIRCDTVSTERLVKSWTNRGTMHLFSADDLPLFLHRGRTHFLRPVDTLEPDAYLSAARKAYFADAIVDAIGAGICERETLKAHCESLGMTETEAKSIFDPWGGLIRALCEEGKICHKVQEQKAFMLCPPFEPMEEAPARLEMARRYFTHFGPASVKDAAYFFGTTQAQIKSLLPQLNVEETHFGGNTYYSIDSAPQDDRLPECLFLAGFDQLMLGYEKTSSLMLPKAHLRDIFTLSGIVRPAVLVRGQVAGWWSLKNRKLKITLFSPSHLETVSRAAEEKWGNHAGIALELQE